MKIAPAALPKGPTSPVALTAAHLTGPSWVDAEGRKHQTAFHNLKDRRGRHSGNIWQVIEYVDRAIWQIVEVGYELDDPESAARALWTLRGIVSSWMRDDVRSAS